MALWGKNDPRWVVTDRQDGHNVNGWHWQEINKMEWTRQRLRELLEGLQLEVLVITELKSVTGDAFLTTRKQNKKAAVHDLVVTLSWEARLESHLEGLTGEVKIAEFTTDCELEDLEYSITVDSTSTAPAHIQEQMKTLLFDSRAVIFCKLREYATELAATEK